LTNFFNDKQIQKNLKNNFLKITSRKQYKLKKNRGSEREIKWVRGKIWEPRRLRFANGADQSCESVCVKPYPLGWLEAHLSNGQQSLRRTIPSPFTLLSSQNQNQTAFSSSSLNIIILSANPTSTPKTLLLLIPL
jgi:hypothetical protein